METIDAAAQQLRVSKAPFGAGFNREKLRTILRNRVPHGPQWQIPEGVPARRDHTLNIHGLFGAPLIAVFGSNDTQSPIRLSFKAAFYLPGRG